MAADRKAYTDCMVPWMKGGGPDRKLRFCIGAKICSGKAATEQEARQICVSLPPKEPKTRKSRKEISNPTNLQELAACATPLIKKLEEISVESMVNILIKCSQASIPTIPNQKEGLAVLERWKVPNG